MFKLRMAVLIIALACSSSSAQPPVRKFDDPGAPPFKVLKTGVNPPLDVDGNFVIGPEYKPSASSSATRTHLGVSDYRLGGAIPALLIRLSGRDDMGTCTDVGGRSHGSPFASNSKWAA